MNRLRDTLHSLFRDSDYAAGILDTLVLLGLVHIKGDRAAPSGKVAGMALDVLRAHLADDTPIALDWENLDAGSSRGVDILRAIETARIATIDHPVPARIVEAAVSIIKTRRADSDWYLMQWDAHAGRYQPLGGKREPHEANLSITLRRELAEELGLPAPPGEEICQLQPVGQGWQVAALSATYGVLTRYTFAFYHVVEARFPINRSYDTDWLTRDEILSGSASDGRPVTEIYQRALSFERLDSLPPTTMA